MIFLYIYMYMYTLRIALFACVFFLLPNVALFFFFQIDRFLMPKEYTYEIEHTWEKQRVPIAYHRPARYRSNGNEADASSLAGE